MCELTRFQAVILRTRQNVRSNAKGPHSRIEDRDNPPVDDHGTDAVDELSEEEKEAEFHRTNGRPHKYKADGTPLVEMIDLQNEVRRDNEIRDPHDQRFHHVHLFDIDEQHAYRSDKANGAE